MLWGEGGGGPNEGKSLCILQSLEFTFKYIYAFAFYVLDTLVRNKACFRIYMPNLIASFINVSFIMNELTKTPFLRVGFMNCLENQQWCNS